jgi:hypothetical protein
MKLTIQMAVLSQLSDIQIELKDNNIEQAEIKLNYVKYLLIKYPDTNVQIETDEITRMQKEVLEESLK